MDKTFNYIFGTFRAIFNNKEKPSSYLDIIMNSIFQIRNLNFPLKGETKCTRSICVRLIIFQILFLFHQKAGFNFNTITYGCTFLHSEKEVKDFVLQIEEKINELDFYSTPESCKQLIIKLNQCLEKYLPYATTVFERPSTKGSIIFYSFNELKDTREYLYTMESLLAQESILPAPGGGASAIALSADRRRQRSDDDSSEQDSPDIEICHSVYDKI